MSQSVQQQKVTRAQDKKKEHPPSPKKERELSQDHQSLVWKLPKAVLLSAGQGCIIGEYAVPPDKLRQRVGGVAVLQLDPKRALVGFPPGAAAPP